MAGIEPDWSRISADLLFSIVKFLPARIDVLRLRAVCRLFHATIPLPPIQYPFPHSILTTTDFLKGPDPNQNDSTLTASTVYAIEPLNRISNTQDQETPQTWVVQVYESNSGKVRIINPMTDKNCNYSEKLPKSLNLLDYRVTEIGKLYHLHTAVGYYHKKVVFSSFLDDEFAVMASYGCKKLGMWRNVDKKWSHIDLEFSLYEYLEDLIYHNYKFYAVYANGRTVSVDPKSMIVTQVATDLQFNRSLVLLSLVGSFNDLFLVGRNKKDADDESHIYIDNDVEAFKLNENKREWVRVVNGLDLVDRVLFVGRFGCTFSVLVKEFPRFKGGCVYYWGDIPDDDDDDNDNDDDEDDEPPRQLTWIHDFNDGAFGHISKFPGYLNFFQPPTAWLKCGDSSLLDVNSLETMNMVKKDRTGNWVLIPAEHVQEDQAERVPAQVPEEAAEPSDRQGKRLRTEASSSHVEEDESSRMKQVLDPFQILTTRLDSLTSHVQDGFQTVYNRLDLNDSRLNNSYR